MKFLASLFALSALALSAPSLADQMLTIQTSPASPVAQSSTVQIAPLGGTPPYTLSIIGPSDLANSSSQLLNPTAINPYVGGTQAAMLTIPNPFPTPYFIMQGHNYGNLVVEATDSLGQVATTTIQVFIN